MTLEPRYTPAVKRAADQIRKLVNDLTLTELLALRDALQGDTPIDFLGVREPLEPAPKTGAGGVALELPDEEER